MIKKQRKGFTLVELLIVIVVIGVLSAMMMLSSTEAVSSARAADIVSNLRNWKTAALAWYSDHIDEVDDWGKIKKTGDKNNSGLFLSGKEVNAADIAKYLGNSNGLKTNDNGTMTDSSGGVYYTSYHEKTGGHDHKYHNWFIVYQLPNANDTTLKKKLEARASTSGLFAKNNTTGAPAKYTATDNNSKFVAIEAMHFGGDSY